MGELAEHGGRGLGGHRAEVHRSQLRAGFPETEQAVRQRRPGDRPLRLFLRRFSRPATTQFAEPLEHRFALTAAPGQQSERVTVELLGHEVAHRGDVLAGVGPVGAGAVGRQRDERDGSSATPAPANTSSISCGSSPASMLAAYTAWLASETSTASHLSAATAGMAMRTL